MNLLETIKANRAAHRAEWLGKYRAVILRAGPSAADDLATLSAAMAQLDLSEADLEQDATIVGRVKELQAKLLPAGAAQAITNEAETKRSELLTKARDVFTETVKKLSPEDVEGVLAALPGNIDSTAINEVIGEARLRRFDAARKVDASDTARRELHSLSLLFPRVLDEPTLPPDVTPMSVADDDGVDDDGEAAPSV